MALEATHIRFALDLKDKYHITELARYISGTIYPDSRYITKIDRALTHPLDYSEWNLAKIDDFKKGWYLHLFCDKIQRAIMKEMLPSAFEGETGQGGEVWIRHTALKILQDMNDVRKFDIKSILPLLNHVENPNGEDIKQLSKYNEIFQKMYIDPANININDLSEMWKEFGVTDELIVKVKLQVKEYDESEGVKNLLNKIYPEMLLRMGI